MQQLAHIYTRTIVITTSYLQGTLCLQGCHTHSIGRTSAAKESSPLHSIPMAATDWVQYDLSSEGDQPCGRLHLHSRAKHYRLACTKFHVHSGWHGCSASAVCIRFGNIKHNVFQWTSDPTCLFEDNLPPSPCQSASRTNERPLTSGCNGRREWFWMISSCCSRWLRINAHQSSQHHNIPKPSMSSSLLGWSFRNLAFPPL